MITGPVTFVGDVHGWSDRLDRILASGPQGTWVFLGDLIDRGPDVRGVVERVRELCRSGQAVCLLGNHEYALIKALGCARLGIAADPVAWDSWLYSHGATPTLAAYAPAAEGAVELAAAMGEHLAFLASLPWVLTGRLGVADALEAPAPDASRATRVPGDRPARAWIAVHAGLRADEPWWEQVASLQNAEAGYWQQPFDLLGPLYDKRRVRTVPADLPQHIDLVSGHTPQAAVLALPQRLVVDTFGGRPERPLSALRWPSGELLVAAPP